MPYQRKTIDIYIVEQYTGSIHTWEIVLETEEKQDAMRTARDYRLNMPEYPVRYRKIRERITSTH